MNFVTDMATAISRTIDDGDHVHMAGFTHLIPFAAGHEMIRQDLADLTISRSTPDVVTDQLVAAGCVDRLIFSYIGNPGVGSLRAVRRAVEDGVPRELEIEESTHLGTVSRLRAAATGLPFLPLKTFSDSEIPKHTETIRLIDNPFGDGEIYVVPPLEPEVAIIGAQRADEHGNAQLWGISGDNIDAAFAADRVLLVVEEVVSESVIASDPNRTVIPGHLVDSVVEEPFGAHPSYAQGYYDRDGQSYRKWDDISSTHKGVMDWLDEWVYGVTDRTEYLEHLGRSRLEELTPKPKYSAPINVGKY